MNKDKLPIWLTDWVFQNPKTKSTHKAIDIICKGWTSEDIINNDMLVKRAMKKLSVKRNKLILKPISVVLKSQHGYGPKYND
tara:strand:- start:1937 stop:2182 length:246 start_codon:yes stop_codon:yes gene_type:complete